MSLSPIPIGYHHPPTHTHTHEHLPFTPNENLPDNFLPVPVAPHAPITIDSSATGMGPTNTIMSTEIAGSVTSIQSLTPASNDPPSTLVLNEVVVEGEEVLNERDDDWPPIGLFICLP